MSVSTSQDDDAADKALVEQEREELKEFIRGLSPEDIKSGGWFTKLLARALSTYKRKATYDYFQAKYDGVPADAIVEQRIRMAARYAAIEGGLSAGAYTVAVGATLGTAGGASALTLPAAALSTMVDVVYTTQLQIRLAHDVAVLYRVPLDTDDPEDLWKLIRVAFTIKTGEAVSEGIIKAVPVVVRPLIKRFYSKAVLQAGKGLPYVGRYLLQRNVIKIGIPLVGVPLAVVLNRYTTLLAGRHAQAVFRNEARVIEVAMSLSEQSRHPQLLLWVAWLVVQADGKVSDDEALLLRHLVTLVRDKHQVVDKELAHVVDIDREDLWRRVRAEAGDLSDLVAAARRAAAVDGPVNKRESDVISLLEEHCRRG